MAQVRVRLVAEGGAHLFQAKYERRLGPALDAKHRNIAARLTRKAKENLAGNILRPQEQGSRPHARDTGRLTGPDSAIKGEVLNPGVTPSGAGRFGKGVGWPDIDRLDRRARHWRRLEFGAGPFQMPRGVFVKGVFYTYGDYLKTRGLRRGSTFGGRLTQRQATARRRAVTPVGLRGETILVGGPGAPPAQGIEAKHFLENAWNEIVGPDGRKAFEEDIKIVEDLFREFQSRATR